MYDACAALPASPQTGASEEFSGELVVAALTISAVAVPAAASSPRHQAVTDSQARTEVGAGGRALPPHEQPHYGAQIRALRAQIKALLASELHPAAIGQGATGTTGATGAQGPQGPEGTNGTNGKDGQQSATGAQGPAGKDGATGAHGPAGKDGANGQQGATGAHGPAGKDGANGQQGATGAQFATVTSRSRGCHGSYRGHWSHGGDRRSGSARPRWNRDAARPEHRQPRQVRVLPHGEASRSSVRATPVATAAAPGFTVWRSDLAQVAASASDPSEALASASW